MSADDNLETVIRNKHAVNADTRLVLIGKTGDGKSSTCNTIHGNNVFFSWVGASSGTKQCQGETTQRAGRSLQVTDTPGLFDPEIADVVNKEIRRCVVMSAPGPHALLLVSRVGRFTAEDHNTVEEFKKMFGKDMVKYLVIIFTGKDDLEAEGVSIESYLSKSPAGLQKLVKEVHGRYLTVNNRASKEEKDKFVKNLLTMVDNMVNSNGGSYYTTSMYHKAEQKVRRKEEEERQRREEADTRKRRYIEDGIKCKYQKLMSDQNRQIVKLQQEMTALQVTGQSASVQYSDKITQLSSKLTQAQQQQSRLEEDRHRWQCHLETEFGKKEEERNVAMATMQSQMEAAVKLKEEEVRDFSAKIEQELQASQKELERRAEEKRRKEQEAHERKMAALAEEKRQEEARIREEQRLQAQREAAMRAEREAAEAAARRRRRRRRRRNDCTLC